MLQFRSLRLYNEDFITLLEGDNHKFIVQDKRAQDHINYLLNRIRTLPEVNTIYDRVNIMNILEDQQVVRTCFGRVALLEPWAPSLVFKEHPIIRMFSYKNTPSTITVDEAKDILANYPNIKIIAIYNLPEIQVTIHPKGPRPNLTKPVQE